jgi:hypothetical protein
MEQENGRLPALFPAHPLKAQAPSAPEGGSLCLAMAGLSAVKQFQMQTLAIG